MGRRGPPKKPTALKRTTGTYRRDRAPKNEATPEAGTPSCPSWLHEEAQREWGRIAPRLERLGLLTELDRAALAAYCEAYAAWHDATVTLRERGMVQLTESGYASQRPEVGIRNSAWKTMRTYIALFGLSPADRASLSVDTPADADPADEFFRGPRLAV